MVRAIRPEFAASLLAVWEGSALRELSQVADQKPACLISEDDKDFDQVASRPSEEEEELDSHLGHHFGPEAIEESFAAS